MPVALFNCLAGRPAGRVSSGTSAAWIGVLLVLAPAVELAAAHGRLAGMGRGVNLQVAVVGVLAGDLLQVLPDRSQRVRHTSLTGPDGFPFDLVAFRVEVRFLPGSLGHLRLLATADDAEPHAGGVRDHDDDRECKDDGEHPVHRRIHQDLTRVFYARGTERGHGVVQLAGLYGLGGCGPLGEEADGWVGGENLLPTRRERHRRVPGEGQPRNPGVLQLAHLYEDCRPDGEGDGRQELVRDAEQREELVDAAQRIVHAGPQEVAPAGDYEGAGYDVAGQPGGAGEGSPHVAYEVLDHEPSDAGSRIDGGQYEQGFEHDGEVVPERLKGRAEEAGNPGEDRGYPDRERRRAAGPADYGVLADGVGRTLERFGAYGEPEAVDGLGGRLDGIPEERRVRVHGEVHAWVERDSGYHGHYGDERLGEHRAVADRSHLRFFLDQLGRGARRDERVEPRERPARDDDKHEREERTGEDRPLAVEGELRKAGHVHRGQSNGYPDGEQGYGPDLHEGGEVVARGQKDPHRQDRGHEAVDYEGQGELVRGERPRRGVWRALRDPTSPDDGEHQKDEADQRDLQNPPRTQEAQVHAHQQGYGDGHRERESAPRGGRERVDHDEGEDGEQDDHDGEHRDQGRDPTYGSDLFPGHLPERFAVPPHGEEERRHVLHGAREDNADDDPDGPWQEAHLGRQYRTDERSRPGYRREVVPEEDPPVHRLEVSTVVEPLSGGSTRVVCSQHPIPNER